MPEHIYEEKNTIAEFLADVRSLPFFNGTNETSLAWKGPLILMSTI